MFLSDYDIDPPEYFRVSAVYGVAIHGIACGWGDDSAESVGREQKAGRAEWSFWRERILLEIPF